MRQDLKILIKRCLKGSADAQEHLFFQFQPMVKSICKRYLNTSDVDDAAQEIWLKVFSRLSNFDYTKAELSTWIGSISINHCIDIIRKHQRQATSQHFDIYSSNDIVKASNFEDKEFLQACLRKLPWDLYVVFNLFHIDGYNHQEVADMLNISEASSRKRLSRAKSKLKDILSKADTKSIIAK